MNDFLEVKVWGELACFTRPEMKVERVSYDVMTPSAARGLLEAIFWKPAFSWRVREIEVLNPIRHQSILRNEVNTRASAAAARAWTGTASGFLVEDDRAQRHTLALRDVAYVIRADQEINRAIADEHPEKYRDQFRRRVAKGQFFAPPCLGCREFPAYFEAPSGEEHPIPLSTDLGRMLFDIDYGQGAEERGGPRFFRARLEDGVLLVPQELYGSRKEA